ncbi:acyl-CoA dehydratase activase [Acetivibrio mesophilus]|uniref:2-hydroxyglutaryl-CoA dehydratase n=1 Tax=Acetivibrio mesophilus TaxID=2487273 RepID=A0A4Q0I1Y2_9FIRM|nr:acyl-CoA dehydratase activase [Acetivibrio mesophilus]ODM27901.1 2-hydroxyglutaryl-CoA dehydratase [Clostridium sp. Bc-iso-3]RXE57675.1 2-hydroxyglutaryl-CoA dehydratase [Acetivibrio mesophilus]HHV28758.1 2-hydroxyglutaryl-CoA dehydratase [Clostridium sp.]
MRVLGIDLGSRAVKLAVFEDGNFSDSMVYDTASFYRDFCSNVNQKISIDFEKLGVGCFDNVVSTGYGRNNVNVENATVILELKAHTFGAVWQTGLEDFTLLDIGGQDSKVISVRNGKMVDMVLNDKCAASCGRYLENMANVLGIGIEELAGYYENPVELNSTCAVFGESELIGKISEGYSIKAMAAGVNHSLFRRIKPIIERFPHENLVVCGGVARNKALLEYIKSELDFKRIVTPKRPQLNGAIGCCAFKIRKMSRS